MTVLQYLADLWSRVADASANTVAWFSSVGNAVASAVGDVLYQIFRGVIDFFWLIGYFVDSLLSVVLGLSRLPICLYNFLATYISALDFSTDYSGIWSSPVLSFVTAIPYWSTLMYGIGVAFIFFILLYFLKTIRR